jgi:hypothetical protein
MPSHGIVRDPSGAVVPNATVKAVDTGTTIERITSTATDAFAPERIDAIEETTVSTTGMGADSAGMGAMGIRFTTRRGTDNYKSTVGEQFANEDLNDGAAHSVNLLTVAAAAGYASTIDPTIAGIFSTINGTQSKSSGYLAITGQPYWQTMEWTQGTNTMQLFPAARLDYQIVPKVAWHGSWSLRYENIHGSAPPYPGLDQFAFTNAYKITTYISTNTVDWTIKPNMINTTMFGVQSNGEYFYQGSYPQEWAPYGNRRLSAPS